MTMAWLEGMMRRLLIFAGSLALGMTILSGCGQKNGFSEPLHSEDEVREEKNSLAEWEASLPQGTPDAFMAEGLRGVTVVRDGTPCFAVSYEPRAYKSSFDCWAISVPYQSMVTVDTEAMYEYFRILEDMELTPVEGISREEAGTEDAPDRIFAAYYSGQTEEGGQAEPDQGVTFYFGNKNEEGNYYVETGGRLWSADSDIVEKLFAVDPYTCILKVVSVVNLDTVSTVNIEFDGKRYEMETDGETFWRNGKKTDSSDFYELYTELMSVFIERELSKEEKEGIKEKDRELLMRVTYERNREDAPKITQCYYAFDETYASVQVNGTEFFLVSRETVDDLCRLVAE